MILLPQEQRTHDNRNDLHPNRLVAWFLTSCAKCGGAGETLPSAIEAEACVKAHDLINKGIAAAYKTLLVMQRARDSKHSIGNCRYNKRDICCRKDWT